MSDTIRSCAFTGHRPHKLPWKYNEEDGRCIALKTALTDQIERLIAAGITDFYSGMADGTDCWAANSVLDLRDRYPGIKLHCVLPHIGQADKWTEFARHRYNAILDRADSVEALSPVYYDGCMLDRNRRLVDSATYLLAVYNGERRGGTAATIRYAQKLKRHIIIIDPASGQIV